MGCELYSLDDVKMATFTFLWAFLSRPLKNHMINFHSHGNRSIATFDASTQIKSHEEDVGRCVQHTEIVRYRFDWSNYIQGLFGCLLFFCVAHCLRTTYVGRLLLIVCYSIFGIESDGGSQIRNVMEMNTRYNSNSIENTICNRPSIIISSHFESPAQFRFVSFILFCDLFGICVSVSLHSYFFDTINSCFLLCVSLWFVLQLFLTYIEMLGKMLGCFSVVGFFLLLSFF